MNLSKSTVELIKNFATINQGLVVKEGKSLRTISTNKAILAEATIEEEFDREFGIYDLPKFLGLLSMAKDTPSIELGDEFVTVNHPLGKIRQRYSPTNLILSPPNKSINVSDYAVELDLPAEKLEWIFNVASILKAPNIVIRGDENGIEIAAMDVKGEIVDDASTTVDGKATTSFQAVIKVENLKLIPGDYQVKLSDKMVSKFCSVSRELHYFVAIEKDSSKFH